MFSSLPGLRQHSFHKRSGNVEVAEVDDPNRSIVGRLVGDPVKAGCEERIGE